MKEQMSFSVSTKLWCIRMYLDRAKQALIDAGGVYSPSKSEQKADLFDASIQSIRKVIFSIGGFFGGYETRTIRLDEDHTYFNAEHSLMLKPSNLPNGLDYPCDRGEFLEGLRKLHIGEWRSSYLNPDILDGTQWELTIEFSDGDISPSRPVAATHIHTTSESYKNCSESILMMNAAMVLVSDDDSTPPMRGKQCATAHPLHTVCVGCAVGSVHTVCIMGMHTVHIEMAFQKVPCFQGFLPCTLFLITSSS